MTPMNLLNSGSRKAFRVGKIKKLRPMTYSGYREMKVLSFIIAAIALIAGGGIYVALDMPVLGIIVAAVGLFISVKIGKNS